MGGPKWSPAWGVAIGVFLFWLAGAFFFPLIQDEAYYAMWARNLAWGYFDHPPAVALLGQLTRVFPGSPFALRAGTLVVAFFTIIFAIRLFTALGFDKRRTLPVAMLLLYGNMLGLVFGFLATPDTGLMLAWVLALHEAVIALRRDPRRWITAGAVTGLGILSKYTMLMIGPVFLLALLVEAHEKRSRPVGVSPACLCTPWPYLGGVVALLVALPHFAWNAQHDWITVRFQTRHGLALAHSQMVPETILPLPLPAKEGSPEYALARPFLDLEKTEKKLAKPRTLLDDLGAGIERYFGFYLSQLALWGGCLVAIIGAWRTRRRSTPEGSSTLADAPISRAVRTLVFGSGAFPLLVCGVLSVFSKVEANWSAMYVFGAAAWMAPWVAREFRRLTWGVAINGFLASLLVLHGELGILPIRPAQDRVLSETHGYPQLPRTIREYVAGKPLLAETYQLTAMVQFFDPGLAIGQWPGLTRDSEFVRRPELSLWTRDGLSTAGEFWLLTTQIPPPQLTPFSGVEMIHLRDCKASDIQVITAATLSRSAETLCRSPIHKWYLVRYELGPEVG